MTYGGPCSPRPTLDQECPYLHGPYLHGLDLHGRDCTLEIAWMMAQSNPSTGQFWPVLLAVGCRETAHEKVILDRKILLPGAGEMAQGIRQPLPKSEV